MNQIFFILLLIFSITGNIILSFEFDVETNHNQRFLDDTYKSPHIKENIYRNEDFLRQFEDNMEKSAPQVLPAYTRKILQPPPLKRSINDPYNIYRPFYLGRNEMYLY
uniref:Uncharacterized protein n=1 Tax=Parastrongyloides trichosuri TaxID=131310 RepID=A0A0N4ZY25_PARTI